MAGGRQLDGIRLDKFHRGRIARVPYFYSLLPRDIDFDDGGAGADVFNPRYIPILSGETKQIPIQLQDDSVYKLLYLHFNVGNTDNQLATLGSTIPNPACPSEVIGGEWFTRLLDINVFASASGGRELISKGSSRLEYGGQGGMAMVRHPYLFPRSSLINVVFTNKSNETLRVDGFFFGYKVQM